MDAIARQRKQDLFGLASVVGEYDDWPLLPPEVDPQLSYSRNSRTQPFYLVFDHDTCLIQFAGNATIRYLGTTVLEHVVSTGDYVYVPAGIPHRIEPEGPCLQLRFTGNETHVEAAIFPCEECGTELVRHAWWTGTTLSQEGYTVAVDAYRDAAASSPCPSCGAVAPEIERTEFRWSDVAAAISDASGEADAGDVPSELRLPDPDRAHPPRTINVFWALTHLNTQLGPIFPELGPGAIVPCAALFGGEADPFTGRFYHQNSVDEVVIVHGAETGGHSKPGFLFVGNRQHAVENFLSDPFDPDQFRATVITVRQAPEGPQQESILLRCEECNHQLIRKDLEFVASDDQAVPSLATIELSADLVAEFNSSEETRTCDKCGNVNRPFHLKPWGWDVYARRHELAERSRRSLVAAGQAVVEQT